MPIEYYWNEHTSEEREYYKFRDYTNVINMIVEATAKLIVGKVLLEIFIWKFLQGAVK